jgi:hypothetical protein
MNFMRSIENATLIERFVQLIPLRYPWAALAWTVILGPPGSIFFRYLDMHNVVFYLTGPVLYNNISLFVTLFYLFYIPRYLRLRIVKAEREITPIMPGGEREYHASFRQLTNPLPVVIVSLPFLTPIPSAVPLGWSFSTASLLVQFVMIALGLGNFIWEYSVFNWGLHRLGKSQLKLKSFLEDRMMGARPIGNAALSATISYLGGILFVILLGTSNPSVNGLGLYIAVVFLLVLGVVMFFLPLNSLHKKMMDEKIRSQQELGRRFLSLTKINTSDVGTSISNEDAIRRLLGLKEFEITEKKLGSTPNWPFDVQVLARLITIVLSVTAVLLSRFITDYLIKI